MRERGNVDEAEQVRATELAALLDACKGVSSDEEITARLDATFAAEEERIATAVVVAELLLPKLARELRAGTVSPLAAAEVAPAPASSTPVSPPVRSPERTAPTDIAGFIDQMFAQADREPDDVPPVRRRAS